METRMQKYKAYRASLINDDVDQTIHEIKINPTQTIGLEEVMVGVKSNEDDDKLVKKAKKEKILKYSLGIGIIVLLIVGIVIFAIFAFGR